MENRASDELAADALHWNKLPAVSRTETSREGPRGTKAKALLQSSDPITLPTELKKHYDQWKVDSANFFRTEPQLRLDTCRRPLAYIYRALSESSSPKATLVVRIRRRFALLVLLRLRQTLSSAQGAIEGTLAEIIVASGLVSDARSSVRDQLLKWQQAGSRYELLSDELGQGCLILLPADISNSSCVNEVRT